jgi:hypothetical protein
MTNYKTAYSNDKNINTLDKGSYTDFGDGTPARQVETSTTTLNADGNKAQRVIITQPAVDDIPSPSDINLSNTNVLESASVGATVANITVPSGGLAPFTFTIIDDPDNKFSITGNDLLLANPVDFSTESEHNVTIQVEDANNKTFQKTFLITVLEAIDALNKKVTFNGIDEAMSNPAIEEFNSVMNRSFTICFSVTKYRENVFEKVLSRQATSINKRGFEISFTPDNRLHFKLISAENTNQLLDVQFNTTHSANDKKFYAITYDGSQIAAGVGGRLNGANMPKTTISNTLVFNQNLGSNQTFFAGSSNLSDLLQGDLSDIMLFSRVLENGEINDIYNGGDILIDLSSLSFFNSNIMHIPVTSNDVYPTLTDLRGNYNITLNANMSQGNIVDV